MNKYEPLSSFLLAIQKLDLSHMGPVFKITVKYRDDLQEYWGWSPPRGDYISDTFIRDPGLGSGPVTFENIEWIMVYSEPRYGHSTEYYKKYACLLELVKDIPNVHATNEAITYNNCYA